MSVDPTVEPEAVQDNFDDQDDGPEQDGDNDPDT